MKKLVKTFIIILFIIASMYFERYIDKIDSNNILNEKTYNASENNTSPYASTNFIKAFVSRIVDGDTIEVNIDSKKYKVRFIGVNCPEYTSKIEYFGKESTEYTNNILYNRYVFLEKDVSETDKYGRLLCYVWLEIPTENTIDEIRTKMFNGLLLDNGYASAVTYPPDVKYSKEFKEIAADARNYNKGLWNK